MTNEDPLKAILTRHGITDAEEYLIQESENAEIVDAGDPDVTMRGNVQLMLEPMLDRATVDKGLSELKYL
jgi:hypothetical protein